MFQRLILLAAAILTIAAAPKPTQRIEIGTMMGRWYEVARLPNKMQRGCEAGASQWTRAADGFSVIQTCRKGSASGPLQEWKAKARVVDPATNNRIQMSFFGGMVKQEYWVLDHHPDQGWLILATPGGHALWLMSQRPVMAAAVKAQALARIRRLGYDVGQLEFPAAAR